MNPNIDIFLSKLSAPVEALHLERRACRALQRASVYTVAELVLRGKPKLFSIRHLGPLTADRIWQALATYLGVSEEQLARPSTNNAGTGCDVWNVPVSVLPLFPSRLQELAWLGCSQIEDLVRARATGYRDLLGIGARELSELDQLLHSYLARAAQAYLLQTRQSHPAVDSSSPKPPPILASVPTRGSA